MRTADRNQQNEN